ncbi:MAG: type II toxin-antitoxin system VapC family toxin [Chloroflexi bacterium]|nr:type II toxin-antitoxin system VapC family toxin [Chloroflexota bacterium]
MPVFYIESSGLFKRYRSEKGTDVMKAVFDEKNDADTFVTSHLVTVEMESAAARGLKGKVLNKRAYSVLLRSFAEDLGTMIVLPVSSALITEAAQEARQHELRALDAIHFATAMRVSQAARDSIVFVASDKDLVKASRTVGFITIDPEEQEALGRLRTLRQGSRRPL